MVAQADVWPRKFTQNNYIALSSILSGKGYSSKNATVQCIQVFYISIAIVSDFIRIVWIFITIKVGADCQHKKYGYFPSQLV